MNAQEFRTAVDSLPCGKRLPGATYLLDLPAPETPAILRTVCDELRSCLEIGPEFNLLKFHLDSPKISFLSYPDFFRDPHPELRLAAAVIPVAERRGYFPFAETKMPFPS